MPVERDAARGAHARRGERVRDVVGAPGRQQRRRAARAAHARARSACPRARARAGAPRRRCRPRCRSGARGSGRRGRDLVEAAAPGRRDQRARGRQPAHQLRELALHVREVAVDVGVVELDRGDDQRVGVVVEELRRLVEEGGVVLVALDHELGPGAVAEAAAEVLGQPADQQRRIAPRLEQQRRHEARGGGLAVRAGDHHRVLAADRVLVERVGEGAVRDAAVDRRARLGVLAAHGVPDHDQVGPPRQHVLGAEAERDRDAPALERRAHRRVDVLVGAGDGVAALPSAGPRASPCPAPAIATKWTCTASRPRRLRARRSWISARSVNLLFFATRWMRLVSITTTASRVEVDPERGAGEAEVPDRLRREVLARGRAAGRGRVPAERPVRARAAGAGASRTRPAARAAARRCGRARRRAAPCRSASRRRRARTGRRGRPRRPSPPRSGRAPRPTRCGRATGSSRWRRSGGARPRPAAPRRKRVSCMPSGAKMRSRQNAVERLAGHRLDHRAEHDEVEVAVDGGAARLVHQRRAADALEDPVVRGLRADPVLALLALALEQRLVEAAPGMQPRGVREQVAQRDALLVALAEVREHLGHRVVEREAALRRRAASRRWWWRAPW